MGEAEGSRGAVPHSGCPELQVKLHVQPGEPQWSTADRAVGKVVLSAWEVCTVLTRGGCTGGASGTKLPSSHLWTL